MAADTQTITIPIALLVLIAERIIDRFQRRNGKGPIGSDHMRTIIKEEHKPLHEDLDVIRERMHEISNQLTAIRAWIEIRERGR